eukprot:m.247048 g.247048  ORF g.247048 m.247048 type:complete len:244 (-) comp22592_c1_seq1:35-766(-)
MGWRRPSFKKKSLCGKHVCPSCQNTYQVCFTAQSTSEQKGKNDKAQISRPIASVFGGFFFSAPQVLFSGFISLPLCFGEPQRSESMLGELYNVRSAEGRILVENPTVGGNLFNGLATLAAARAGAPPVIRIMAAEPQCSDVEQEVDALLQGQIDRLPGLPSPLLRAQQRLRAQQLMQDLDFSVSERVLNRSDEELSSTARFSLDSDEEDEEAKQGSRGQPRNNPGGRGREGNRQPKEQEEQEE